MTEKLEQVVRGLECCTTQGFGCIENKKCPYGAQRYGSHCVDSMLRDALALLKAQEPVKPVFDAGDGKTIGQFLCGKCHAKIGFGHPNFCWYCGQELKWE